MIDKIKKFIATYQGKGTIYLAILAVLTGVWFVYSFFHFQQMVMLPTKVFSFAIGAGMLFLYDVIVLKDTDTNEMVKQGNNWGLLMLALALLWFGS